MPLVSVIVPAYNAEETLLETMQSVLSQTFTDLELIVVDDGSADNTVAIARSVKDPRVRVCSYPNGGAALARNRGIALSNGAFLSFLDSDDLWTSDKLEKQLNALQANPEAGGAYSWTLIMDEKGENFYPGNCESYEGDVYPHLLLSNFIGSGSNMLVRREASDTIGGFDTTLYSHEDWDYYLRLSRQWLFVSVSEPQILYRKREDSVCSNFEVMEKYIFVLHKKMFKSVPPALRYLEPQSRAKKYEFLTQIALTHISSWQDCRRAIRTLTKAATLHPSLLRTRRFQILVFKLLVTLSLTPKLANRALFFLMSLRAKQYMARRTTSIVPS